MVFEVNIPYFLFNKTTLICIFISINVSLKLSQELDNRTINNKLFCGYNKYDILQNRTPRWNHRRNTFALS